MKRVQRAQSFASNPFLSLVVVLSIYEQRIELWVSQASGECRNLELTMGYDVEDYDIDLDQITESSRIPQRLKSLLTWIADIEYYCAVIIPALNCLESQLEDLPDGYCPSVCTELREQVVYLRESSVHTSIVARRGKDILQAMVQTVCIPYWSCHQHMLTVTGIRKSPAERYDADYMICM